MQSRRFLPQAFDPEYGHPAFETMVISSGLKSFALSRCGCRGHARARLPAASRRQLSNT